MHMGSDRNSCVSVGEKDELKISKDCSTKYINEHIIITEIKSYVRVFLCNTQNVTYISALY